MRFFAKLAISAYFFLAATLACNAEISLLGTALSVSAEQNTAVEEDNATSDTTADTTTVAAVKDEKAAQEAKTDNQETVNPMVTSFLSELRKMADEIEKTNASKDVWYWSNSNNKNTFKQQKASDYKVTNDALFTCWALVNCNILEKGDLFFCSDGQIINNGGNPEAAIEKYFDVIYISGKAKNLVKQGKIIAGDICGYNYTHTSVYAGNNMWYDPSPKTCEVKNRNGKDYFVKIMTDKAVDNHKVAFILRFKNGKKAEEKKENKAVASAEKKESKAEKATSANEDYTGPYQKDCKSFLAALKKMSQKCAEDYKNGKEWLYSNSKCNGTFAAAVKNKNRRTNCARYVDWGLSEIGVLNGESFWTTDAGVIHWGSKSAKDKVKKYCKIITVKKKMSTLIKNGTLQAGDICCYNFCHTNVYAGNNSWYDGGRRSDSTFVKNGEHYFKKWYSKKADLNWTVNYIIRFK